MATASASAFFFNKIKPSLYVVPKLGEVVSAETKLIQITKPWLCLKVFNDNGFAERLPEHYKQFYWSWKHGPKTPVHFDFQKGNFKLGADRTTVVPVKNDDIQVVYPDNMNNGLWGGEGIIKGYKHVGRYKGELARYWHPALQMAVVYSEILDRYMEITVTNRCLKLIDEHFGFDFYLLESSYSDINSVLGFRLKREMLLALANQTLYPDDPPTREEIIQKYKKFIIPIPEADWLGLTLDEAIQRQQQLEDVTPQQLKTEFRSQLIQYLHANPPTEENPFSREEKKTDSDDSWIKRFNPFKKSS